MRNCDALDSARKWPRDEWAATCRRMRLCLKRRSRDAAVIALDSFIAEHLSTRMRGQCSIWSLTPQLDEGTIAILDNAGYRTVDDLRAATDEALLQQRHIGALRLAKLRAVLEE